MKNMKKYTLLIASLFLLGGCAASQTVRQLETQNAQGVFQVVKDADGQPSAGYGDLKIALNLKTRNPGTFLVDTTGYGTERYKLLIGINGQTETVAGVMTPESGEYKGSKDPEAGNGVRYLFAKTLRLPVGEHRLVLALPGDKVLSEHVVKIKHGVNALNLQPVYGRKSSYRMIGFYGATTYFEGVRSLAVAAPVA